MGKGDELLALLASHGLTQVRLAREMSRSNTSVGRYVDAIDVGRLADDTRAEMVQALDRLGVRGPEVAAILPAAAPDAPGPEQLIASAVHFTTLPQLEALLASLDAPREARERLRAYVLGRLFQLRARSEGEGNGNGP